MAVLAHTPPCFRILSYSKWRKCVAAGYLVVCAFFVFMVIVIISDTSRRPYQFYYLGLQKRAGTQPSSDITDPPAAEPDSALTISARNLQNLERTRGRCSELYPGEVAQSAGGWSDLGYVESRRLHLEYVLVDRLNRYLYCYVPKVSCTTWKTIFLRLRYNITVSGRDDPIIHCSRYTKSPRLSAYPPRHIAHMLRTYRKFVFVRHPLERLVSAFYDKFRDHMGLPDMRTFQEAMRIYNFTWDDVDTVGLEELARRTTFRQFAEYIVRESGPAAGRPLDRHWRPQEQLCAPCLLQYHFIGRYEHMWEDSNHVLRHVINVTRSDVTYPRRSDLTDTEQRYWTPRNTSRLLEEHLAELDRDTLTRLKEVYEKDAQLFGYTF